MNSIKDLLENEQNHLYSFSDFDGVRRAVWLNGTVETADSLSFDGLTWQTIPSDKWDYRYMHGGEQYKAGVRAIWHTREKAREVVISATGIEVRK